MDGDEHAHEPNVTTLRLVGGHVLEVKTPLNETVEERLRREGWPVTYHEYRRDQNGEAVGLDYTFTEASWATFERPHGRKPVRVRTDTVVAIE